MLWALAGGIALGLLLVVLFVPNIPPTERRVHFDWAGGLLLGGSATVLVYALAQGSTWGWTDARILGLLALAAVLAAAFTRRAPGGRALAGPSAGFLFRWVYVLVAG